VAKKLAKRRGAFILVCILVGLLVLWWSISSLAFVVSTPQEVSTPDAAPVIDSRYTPTTEVLVRHTVVEGAHIYRGFLTIPADCDVLSTSIMTSGTSVIHVKVSLKVLRLDSSCISNNLLETPFSVSFLSRTQTAVVFDGLTINNAKIPYSLVEGK